MRIGYGKTSAVLTIPVVILQTEACVIVVLGIPLHYAVESTIGTASLITGQTVVVAAVLFMLVIVETLNTRAGRVAR